MLRIVITTVLVVSAWVAPADAQALFVSRCQTDEITSDSHEPYQQAALRYATALVNQDAAEIRRLSSTETSRGITPEQIKTALLPQLAPFLQRIGERRVA